METDIKKEGIQMQESKVKIWLRTAVGKAKEVAGPILACLIPGIIIGGSVTALRDSRRIAKLENRLGEHTKNNNDNVEIYNNFVDWTHSEIDRLTRQNNELLEKALRETEGKAS